LRGGLIPAFMNQTSPAAPQASLGAVGEPPGRHHGMEPNGEFLLQLLQGGGVGGASGRRVNANGEPSVLEEFPHGMAADEASAAWHHPDPAVAALGPSHSYHGGEMLLQPNQLFMPSQYVGGGVWTPQQQQHQFFPPSHDPRGFVHARGPPQFPPYPPEAPAWRSENSMLRRPDAPWLPPRQGMGDGRWSGPVQGKSPLPPPPPIHPQQQFLGNGAELLQLLLGGQSSAKATPGGVGNPGFPEELFGEGLSGGIQVENALPRAQVHGPIGPPKRNEAAEQSSAAGGGDLLGRFWATAANGSPEPIKSGKANLAVQEDQLRKLSLTGGHGKEGLGLHHQRTYGFSPDQSKSKVSKPPGFFGERDQNTGVPSDPSTLNRFSDLQGVSKGALTWEKGTGGLKQESRPSDDRGESFLGDG
jgi:hypothetical protein